MPIVDEVSPSYYGEERIRLTLSQSTSTPRAQSVVRVDCDYSDADSLGGVAPPFEVVIAPPGRAGFRRLVFRNRPPVAVLWQPREAGPHLVLVRELGHDRFVGRLIVDVVGTSLENPAP